MYSLQPKVNAQGALCQVKQASHKDNTTFHLCGGYDSHSRGDRAGGGCQELGWAWLDWRVLRGEESAGWVSSALHVPRSALHSHRRLG